MMTHVDLGLKIHVELSRPKLGAGRGGGQEWEKLFALIIYGIPNVLQ